MEIKKKTKVTHVKEETIGFVCDCCGKSKKGSSLPNNWFGFMVREQDKMTRIQYIKKCYPQPKVKQYFACSLEHYIHLLKVEGKKALLKMNSKPAKMMHITVFDSGNPKNIFKILKWIKTS